MNDLDPPEIDEGGEVNRATQLGLSDEVYAQLKQMAHAHLRTYKAGMTLNCTALVHEVFLKLHDSSSRFKGKDSKNHFLAVASLAMRHILVD